MPWSPTPTDEFEKGIGWAVTPVVVSPLLPGWTAPPQPVYCNANAVITVTAAGALVLTSSAPSTVQPAAAGGINAAAKGYATLAGGGTSITANAVTDADATFTVDAQGLTSISADAGFPYTLPIVFGGAPALEVFTVAAAAVTVAAAASVEAAVSAEAAFTVIASASTFNDTAGGFPYEFGFILGGVGVGDLFPLEFPFALA